MRTGVEIDADGTTLVDLDADVGPGLLARIRQLGGVVVDSHPEYGAIRARLPLVLVESLAQRADVRRIRTAARAYTNAIDVSEGDVAHRAERVRALFGVDGSGVSVGVLSDGVDQLVSLQSSGDLPNTVTVLSGQAGSGSEGTAILEIVHDLAPGADLLFATAFGGEANFAANIAALANAGANVIVDDVGYFAEGALQDDIVAAAVDDAAAQGVVYFSSAGNAGNANDGTAGVWEGDYVFSGTVLNTSPPPRSYETQDFGGSYFNTITHDSPFLFTLHWSDPLGASSNDYDLLLVGLDEYGQPTSLLAASTNTQNGNDDPFEFIDSGPFNDTGNALVVGRLSGSARFLHLNANRGRLAFRTDGQTSGHSSARGAISVAAVDVADAMGPGGAFDGGESVETFSSDGPRRVFFEENGTAITPGNFSSTGGELRDKPDLTAADGVSTATPGFGTFFGTSAAAPHAAAVAALLLELDPGATVQEVRDALTTTALDIEAPGPDRDSGAGIVDAFDAAVALVGTPCADGVDNDGDGDTDLDDGQCVSPSDRSELPDCSDGLDNDGDGAIDTADVGCNGENANVENPRCQDGLDNDGDSFVDFDGGASALGTATTDPDPQCISPFDVSEGKNGCGLGAEVLLAVWGVSALRRRLALARNRATGTPPRFIGEGKRLLS